MGKMVCGICGRTEETDGYSKRRYCDSCKINKTKESARERMRKYRLTEIGREKVKIGNLRYKREVVRVACLICNDLFDTTRKSRKYCDKVECQEKAKYDRVNRSREKRYDWYNYIGGIHKCAQRAFEKLGIDKKCDVCGSEYRIHLHHHNYEKPREVIPVCSLHHKELHSWDSHKKDR